MAVGRIVVLALVALAGLSACTAPPPSPTPTPPAAVFSPPSPAGPVPASPSPPPSPPPGPIATRVSIIVPGAGPSPSPLARPGTATSPLTRPGSPASLPFRPAGAESPSPGPARSASPAASPTPGPLTGSLVYERGGSIVMQGAASGEPRTLVPGSDLSGPRWSPDGRSVLFTGGVGQAAELYVVPAAGGSPRRLTSNARPERDARWSPRGDRVAYSQPRALGPGGSPSPTESDEIWIIDVASGTERKVADGFDPAWAPDGTRLAYATNGRRTDLGATDNAIHVIQADGSGDQQLLDVSAIPQDLQPAYDYPFRPGTFRLRAPAWAPDGRRLVASADGHTAMAVTFDEQGQDLGLWALAYEGGVGRARWAPHGDRLAVESEPATGVDVVLVVDLPSSSERRIGGIRDGVAARDAAWAPDGSRLALVAGPPTERPEAPHDAPELRIFLADGSPVRTVATGQVAAPSWSGATP